MYHSHCPTSVNNCNNTNTVHPLCFYIICWIRPLWKRTQYHVPLFASCLCSACMYLFALAVFPEGIDLKICQYLCFIYVLLGWMSELHKLHGHNFTVFFSGFLKLRWIILWHPWHFSDVLVASVCVQEERKEQEIKGERKHPCRPYRDSQLFKGERVLDVFIKKKLCTSTTLTPNRGHHRFSDCK